MVDWTEKKENRAIEEVREKNRKTNCKYTHKLKLKCKHKHTNALGGRR